MHISRQNNYPLQMQKGVSATNGKLICMIGLPGSGKSSVTTELSKILNKTAFCEPEEPFWPDCVTKRTLSGAFSAHMWFRSLRTCQLYQASMIAKQGHTALVDSYFDKLMYFCLGRPGMEWLLNPDDSYFDVARQMARVDLETLPLPDFLIFFDLDFKTWRQLLQTRLRQTEVGLFTDEVFCMQEYIRSGVEFLHNHLGVKTITVKTKFGSPKETAEQIYATLCDNGSLSLDRLAY